jgi:hypothetical protein
LARTAHAIERVARGDRLETLHRLDLGADARQRLLQGLGRVVMSAAAGVVVFHLLYPGGE